MADWATISSLATAGGTLVLAIATFAAVRSANRSTELAELALHEQMRPVLVQSRLDDPEQKIMFADRRWVRVLGGSAAVEESDGNIYLAMSVRNVGSGIGVLLGWHVWSDLALSDRDHAPQDEFRRLTRDLYVPGGDIGIWQGRLRDPDEEIHRALSRARAERTGFTVELLYTDHVGVQQTISRFGLIPAGEERWIASVTRHWTLDRAGPRPG